MRQVSVQNQRTKLNLWLILLVTMFIFIFPKNGKAEEENLRFYVTPEFPQSQVEGSNSYFDLNLSKGEKEELTLKLQNASSEPIQVEVSPHTAFTNVHGEVEYGKDALDPDPTLPYSLDELIITPDLIVLEGNETKIVRVPLHMPEEAFEGFLAGGLRIMEVKEKLEEQTNNAEGVAIKNEFAYVIGVVVSNTRDSVQPNLELLDVFADQLNYRNVISATIQNFTPTFVNRMSIEATVQRVGENDVLYEAKEEMMQMAPNSHFHFPISLNGDRFRSGNYLLKLTARSGDDEWEWERTFTIENEEARALNNKDVTLDKRSDLWGILIIALIIMFILIIVLVLKIYMNSKKHKEV